MTQIGRAGIGARLQEPDGPAVSSQDLACRGSPLVHLRPPVPAGHRELDLAEDDVDERGEDLVLVGDVVVDRHRLGAELLRQRADGERSQTAGVGDRERGLDHALAGQPRSPAAVLADHLGHESSLIRPRPWTFSYTVRYRRSY